MAPVLPMSQCWAALCPAPTTVLPCGARSLDRRHVALGLQPCQMLGPQGCSSTHATLRGHLGSSWLGPALPVLPSFSGPPPPFPHPAHKAGKFLWDSVRASNTSFININSKKTKKKFFRSAIYHLFFSLG